MIIHCWKKHKTEDFPSPKCADVLTDVYTEAAQLASPMQYTLGQQHCLPFYAGEP
jgi:hypothetical protein